MCASLFASARLPCIAPIAGGHSFTRLRGSKNGPAERFLLLSIYSCECSISKHCLNLSGCIQGALHALVWVSSRLALSCCSAFLGAKKSSERVNTVHTSPTERDTRLRNLRTSKQTSKACVPAVYVFKLTNTPTAVNLGRAVIAAQLTWSQTSGERADARRKCPCPVRTEFGRLAHLL